jgi:hypothetical protein
MICHKEFKDSDNIVWAVLENGILVETTQPGALSFGVSCFKKFNKKSNATR